MDNSIDGSSDFPAAVVGVLQIMDVDFVAVTKAVGDVQRVARLLFVYFSPHGDAADVRPGQAKRIADGGTAVGFEDVQAAIVESDLATGATVQVVIAVVVQKAKQGDKAGEYGKNNSVFQDVEA